MVSRFVFCCFEITLGFLDIAELGFGVLWTSVYGSAYLARRRILTGPWQFPELQNNPRSFRPDMVATKTQEH